VDGRSGARIKQMMMMVMVNMMQMKGIKDDIRLTNIDQNTCASLRRPNLWPIVYLLFFYSSE
jgi:hypothetical protein